MEFHPGDVVLLHPSSDEATVDWNEFPAQVERVSVTPYLLLLPLEDRPDGNQRKPFLWRKEHVRHARDEMNLEET